MSQLSSLQPPLDLESTSIAFFQHIAEAGKNVPLRSMLDGIKSGLWAAQIERLRAKPKGSPQFDALKTKLPCFMLSGTTNGGHKTADVGEHSGLLQIDIDDVGTDRAPDLRDRIGEDPHIVAAWLSPSGEGVKAIMLIPADEMRHRASFEAAADYMRETYSVTIDPKCSDVSRLCFVSHDPEIALNPDAVPLVMNQGFVESQAGQQQEDSSVSLGTESPFSVLGNTSIFLDFPDLKRLYFKLVEGRIGKPQRGERNAAMVELVASCFCVVCPEFVIAFAKEFFNRHAEAFAGYRAEKYQHEVLSMVEGCLRDYPERQLSEIERQAYHALPSENERAAFRIAKSLSKCESDAAMPPPLFHLSCDELRKRIKVLKMQAWRILRRFEQSGIIKMEKPGTQRLKGKAGIATVYRWMLG